MNMGRDFRQIHRKINKNLREHNYMIRLKMNIVKIITLIC